ncbi:MAG: ABC transporter ATP-binding protein [Armatimonadota bacterium]
MIVASDVSLVYNDHGREVFACREVNLTISGKEFIGVLGPSGSGKSSLLYLLSGLKDPTDGAVRYRGVEFQACDDRRRAAIRRKEFGFVFQYPYLIGFLSALENVLTGWANGAEGVERAADLLERLGLGEKMHRRPDELSGGERQRVCIARALLNGPKALFADEPTASLDPKTGEEVVRLLAEHRTGALILVTHDRRILSGADRVLRMEDGRVFDD